MATIRNYKLGKPEIKQLLQDVEATGFSRDRVSIRRLVDARPRVYGLRGSSKRQAYCRKFSQLKRNSLRNYRKKCRKHGVQLNAANRALIDADADSDDDEDSDKDSNEDSDEDEDDKDSNEIKAAKDDGEENDARGVDNMSGNNSMGKSGMRASYPKSYEALDSDNIEHLSYLLTEKAQVNALKSQHHAAKAPPPKTPPKTPPRERQLMKDRDPRSPPRFTETFPSSPPYKATVSHTPQPPVASMSSDHTQDLTEEMTVTSAAAPKGCRENPYISYMDVTRPELNRDFCAQFVPNMEHHDWSRPGIVVRKLVATCDEDNWSAEIPAKHEFPDFVDRCLMIKCPAYDFFQLHPELYHEKTSCKATKVAHDGYLLQGNLADWVHHLVIFPEGMELENAHFAGEATNHMETHLIP